MPVWNHFAPGNPEALLHAYTYWGNLNESNVTSTSYRLDFYGNGSSYIIVEGSGFQFYYDDEEEHLYNVGNVNSMTLYTAAGYPLAQVTELNLLPFELLGTLLSTSAAALRTFIEGDAWTFNGSAGNDTIAGGNLADAILAHSGNDTVHGLGGADYLEGASGDDKLYGDDSNDSIDGGSGSDRLYGDVGNDTIIGGIGNDTLVGGSNIDRLTGGSGNDQFRFVNTPGTSHKDAITDFKHGQDKIALTASKFADLGASLTADEFGAKTSGHTASGNQHIIYDKSTGKLWYDADDNGSGAAIQFATLSNKPADLSYSDFLIV